MACDARTPISEYEKNKFVISACGFTWQGYSELLAQRGLCSTRIMMKGEDATQDPINTLLAAPDSDVSVFLTGGLSDILITLKQCSFLLNSAPGTLNMVIYTRLPASWVYRMTLSLLIDKKKVETVRIGSLSHSCEEFLHDNVPRLEDAARMEERLTSCFVKGLTAKELDVVLSSYQGVSVKKQSDESGLAIKTIYTHRKEGLRKLQFLQPWLNDVSWLRTESGHMSSPNNNASHNKELEFQGALLKNEIFPVYQIITDRDKKGIGFEILLRWNRNGEIIQPARFLENLHNRKIWLQLTAMVIDAAVRGINKYNGKFYFSINIPPELASGNALPGMAKKAVELLTRTSWAEKLVFEFAETIDVTQDKAIPETMQRIRSAGCRLFLDDCFSSDHVMFPVRQIRFDGLKLDKDIVDKFVANDSDYSLIKAMQYYSDITGSVCVAEGVDSKEKFEKLTALGVNSFQGYYLSRAVKEDELDRTVQQFS